jgi:predicted Zn-dependent protease
MGDINEAIDNIKRASELDPSNLEIAMEELRFLYQQKKFKDAEIKAKTILVNHENNQDALILFAQSQAKQGKFDNSLQTLSEAI